MLIFIMYKELLFNINLIKQMGKSIKITIRVITQFLILNKERLKVVFHEVCFLICY